MTSSLIDFSFLPTGPTSFLWCSIEQEINLAWPKPRFISADHKPESGGGDAIVYDVADERVGTTLEMKQNEAYGVAKSEDNN